MIQGQVTDLQTGETLPGAHVYVSDANGNPIQPSYGTTTDMYGNFAFEPNPGTLITISYVGYTKQVYPVDVLYEMQMVQLSPSGVLNDVVVFGKKSYTKYILAFSLILALIIIIYLKKKGILS